MRGRLFKLGKWLAIALLTPIVLFLLAAWIGAMIPRNGDWVEPDPAEERTVPIMIGSNGIHTEIIMPITTEQIDWSAIFSASDVVASDEAYTHVAVGWGERAFFLETPTWRDFKLSTGVNALTGGEGVLHVAHYVRPAPSEDTRVLHLRPQEYADLFAEVFTHLDGPDTRETLRGYGDNDVFYTARGTYHLGNTCNQWTSDRLAAAGVEVGQWTPLPSGVMQWVPSR